MKEVFKLLKQLRHLCTKLCRRDGTRVGIASRFFQSNAYSAYAKAPFYCR